MAECLAAFHTVYYLRGLAGLLYLLECSGAEVHRVLVAVYLIFVVYERIGVLVGKLQYVFFLGAGYDVVQILGIVRPKLPDAGACVMCNLLEVKHPVDAECVCMGRHGYGLRGQVVLLVIFHRVQGGEE